MLLVKGYTTSGVILHHKSTHNHAHIYWCVKFVVINTHVWRDYCPVKFTNPVEAATGRIATNVKNSITQWVKTEGSSHSAFLASD